MEHKTMEGTVKLALNLYHKAPLKYSADQSNEVLRKALIDANNGKDYLDWRDIRDGKCGAFYTIMEQIIQNTVNEGFDGNEFFNQLVETVQVPFGDQPAFIVEGNDMFVVSEISGGNQGIRRQRLSGAKTVTIPTTWKAIKTYEEIERLLAGKIMINDMIDRVSKSFMKNQMDDVYGVFGAATKDDLGGDVFIQKGSYDDDALLDLINHVEAETGAQAVIQVTKKCARRLATSSGTELSGQAKDDLYNYGSFGKFFGTPIVVTPQRHKVGTREFAFDDNAIHVIASAGKPIKQVIEGNPIMNMDVPMTNPDMVQNYFYAQKTGIGLAMSAGGIGRYEITA